MTLQIELPQLITVAIALLGAFAGLLKLLMTQQTKQIEASFSAQNVRLESIERTNREEAGNWQRIERELMGLKAELPVSYVRRDDYIRGQSVLEAKLDGLATKIENAQLRGLIRNPGDAK
jgi:hypothetical protein